MQLEWTPFTTMIVGEFCGFLAKNDQRCPLYAAAGHSDLNVANVRPGHVEDIIDYAAIR
jgi:hypothetical protein